MKVYAVVIFCEASGGNHRRWIDSQWAVEKKAQERATELSQMFEAFEVTCHEARIVELSVVDVAIQKSEQS
jgi:hypothetical protein